MSSEFDFELSQPRRRIGPWVGVVAGVAVLLGLPAGDAWVSHARMAEAETEFQMLKAALAAASAPKRTVFPPYYEQAKQALELLNWPFDEGLRELEHCLSENSRLKSLHLDVPRKELKGSVERVNRGQNFKVEELMVCLNTGSHHWQVLRIRDDEVGGSSNLSLDLLGRWE